MVIMKILLTNYFGIGAGGAETSTEILAEGLIDNKIEVSVASTEDYNVKTIKFNKFLPLTVFQKTTLKKFFVKLIKKEKFDLIHAQDRLTSFAAILAAKETNIPVVNHFRDYWFACVKSTCLKPNLENCNCTFNDILESYPFYRVPWELLKINLKSLFLHIRDDKMCFNYLHSEFCKFLFFLSSL